jgi:hypothetical protein
MIWIVITAAISALLSSYLGYRRIFHLHHITPRKLGVFGVIVISVYSLLMWLFKIEIMSEAVGGAIITNVYASIFGFFSGSAIEQYSLKTKSGVVLYTYRSFMTDHAPILVAIAIILFGVYRTSILGTMPATPIRLGSGMSFIAFGIWGMTLKLVPEFRKQGIIILDVLVPWSDLVNYSWFLEEILEVEYRQDGSIRSFKTYIPPDERAEIDELLRQKMLKKIEEAPDN